MQELMTKLEDVIAEIIEEKAREFDFGDIISDAVKDFNLESAVENAIDDYDLGRDIEKKVESELDDADIDGKAEDAVNEIVDAAVATAIKEQLPGVVKETFLELLKDKDFLEQVTAALFERVE